MKPILSLALLTLLTQPAIGADIRPQISELPAADIEAAIARGAAAKNLAGYPIRIGKAMERMNPIIGAYSTPARRVELAAFDAKRRYNTFTSADVTAEMTRPTLDVVVMAQQVVGFWSAQPTFAQVLELVITGKNGGGSPVRPLTRESVPAVARNLYGFTLDTPGVFATFPLDALKDGNELHIVFDQKALGVCADCTVKFKVR